jgi:hypothetical protein
MGFNTQEVLKEMNEIARKVYENYWEVFYKERCRWWNKKALQKEGL